MYEQNEGEVEGEGEVVFIYKYENVLGFEIKF